MTVLLDDLLLLSPRGVWEKRHREGVDANDYNVSVAVGRLSEGKRFVVIAGGSQ